MGSNRKVRKPLKRRLTARRGTRQRGAACGASRRHSNGLGVSARTLSSCVRRCSSVSVVVGDAAILAPVSIAARWSAPIAKDPENVSAAAAVGDAGAVGAVGGALDAAAAVAADRGPRTGAISDALRALPLAPPGGAPLHAQQLRLGARDAQAG